VSNEPHDSRVSLTSDQNENRLSRTCDASNIDGVVRIGETVEAFLHRTQYGRQVRYPVLQRCSNVCIKASRAKACVDIALNGSIHRPPVDTISSSILSIPLNYVLLLRIMHIEPIYLARSSRIA